MLLLMPAWRPAGRVGIKLTTVNVHAAPSVRANYLLLDGPTGTALSLLEGAMLTSRRTAAASALAADYLAPRDAMTLLVVGTGALALHLIEAHASVRAIRRVLVWGRDLDKARSVAEAAAGAGFTAVMTPDLATAQAEADIVSVATLSQNALISGALLRDGQHIDLVGAFKPDMCEADPATFARARIFVDTEPGVMSEAGDLLQAIAAGTISPSAIEGDLASLCRGDHRGRDGDAGAITLFKSVGASLEDLAAAELVTDAWLREQGTK